ncbi:YitT family protein, partial [Pseudomonas sp. 2822-17]|uniref:YitT family protein n=1 Tax=Pseudomonas sp. 2822-17 TaxID=1712678 RepID=UPI00117A32F7
KPEEVGEALMNELDIQLTYLHGEGGYTKESRKIIYCITNRFMYPKVRELVLSIDSDAVLEASMVNETTGIKHKRFNRF